MISPSPRSGRPGGADIKAPPEDLDETALAGAVAAGWGLEVDSISYMAVGGGSHHWLLRTPEAGYRFLTVDDLGTKPWLGADHDTVFSALGVAYTTARRLRDAGLEFVVAPIPNANGSVVERFDDRYSSALFPYVAGRAGSFGEPYSRRDTTELCDLWARLHEVRDTAPNRSLDVPGRSNLEGALADLDETWAGGPYSERARGWLNENHDLVLTALARYDRLAAEIAARDFVITHGEPHAGNLIRTEDGLRLVDWDTVALAPPERDLWMLEDLRPYEAATGWTVDRSALDFYRLAWPVTDVAGFVEQLRGIHPDDANAAHAMRALEVTGEQLRSLL